MDVDIAAVDAWLAERKTLSGAFPGWGRVYGRDHTARWGIIDSIGVQSGELAFSVDRTLVHPTIAAIMNQKLVYRIDLVPEAECKPNHFSGRALGLPGTVCGSHFHRWEHNRDYVSVHGFGELPLRDPTPRALKTLEQALAALCDALNIELTSDQRDVRLPSQADLF